MHLASLTRWRLILLALVPLAAAAGVPEPAVTQLAERAAAAGEIRVIVELDLPHEPAGRMGPAELAQQGQAIAAAQQSVAAQSQGTGARELHRFRHIPFALYRADARGIETLGRLPLVIGLQEDVPEPPALAQSAPLIGAPAAWAAGFDGAGQVIAVLDTGVDLAHAFFSAPGKVVAEACFTSTDQDYSSLCPGGADSSLAAGSGNACPVQYCTAPNDCLPTSGCDHGTHVAGIALGDDGVGPDTGIAPGAGLISIQVFSRFIAVGGYAVSAYPSDQIRALEQLFEWRDTYPIAAVNISIGGGYFSDQASCDAGNVARKAAIDNVRSAGIATIIASGNASQRNGMTQPGCISSAVSVGATTDLDTVASFSNVAPFIGLLAPGVNIRSAALGGGTKDMSGTSMATPHATGAWAVLRQAAPVATVDEILAVLKATGTPVDDTRSNGTVTGMARINLDLALAALIGTEPEFGAAPAGGALLDFGSVYAGTTSAEKIVTVSNAGGGAMTLACSLGGTDPERFAILECESAVPPQGTSEIRLTCSPESPGPLTATLELATNDADEAAIAFVLACEGVSDTSFVDGFEGS